MTISLHTIHWVATALVGLLGCMALGGLLAVAGQWALDRVLRCTRIYKHVCRYVYEKEFKRITEDLEPVASKEEIALRLEADAKFLDSVKPKMGEVRQVPPLIIDDNTTIPEPSSVQYVPTSKVSGNLNVRMIPVPDHSKGGTTK